MLCRHGVCWRVEATGRGAGRFGNDVPGERALFFGGNKRYDMKSLISSGSTFLGQVRLEVAECRNGGYHGLHEKPEVESRKPWGLFSLGTHIEITRPTHVSFPRGLPELIHQQFLSLFERPFFPTWPPPSFMCEYVLLILKGRSRRVLRVHGMCETRTWHLTRENLD